MAQRAQVPADENPLRLNLPARSAKPRETGLTILIDPGAPTRYFTDVIHSSAELVDLVKFGWGTALVTADLDEKIDCLNDLGIGYFFGGTLFERCYQEHRVDEYVHYCEDKGCRYVEVSNGTINLSNHDKARMIRELAPHFTVLSEVGYKDADRSLRLHPARWIEYLHEDLDAGARWSINEARESGPGGICRSDGELRFGLIEEILNN
ncbi:MAG: phosphosulfolactate synthase, partial [Clostridia bacterium]